MCGTHTCVCTHTHVAPRYKKKLSSVVVAVIFLRTSLIKHTINITSSSTCISLFYIYCFTSPLTFSLQSLCSSLFHFQSSVGLSPITIFNIFSAFAISSFNSFCVIFVNDSARTFPINAIALCKLTKQYPALLISALELR